MHNYNNCFIQSNLLPVHDLIYNFNIFNLNVYNMCHNTAHGKQVKIKTM